METTLTAASLRGPVLMATRAGIDGYLQAIADDAERFVTAAELGSLDDAVDTCPGWDVRDLVRHVGLVHLWAAANITFPTDRWLTVRALEDLQPYWPELTAAWPSDPHLLRWYDSTVTTLMTVLAETSSSHECLTFLPAPSPVAMWARRQASELAIHRYDLESVRQMASSFDPTFALDMLDELLCGFVPRMQAPATGARGVIEVYAHDVDARFAVSISPDGLQTTRSPGQADLRIEGTAAELYVLLWNRPAGSTVSIQGNADLLRTWRESCRIEWR